MSDSAEFTTSATEAAFGDALPWTTERVKDAARHAMSAGSPFAALPRALRLCAALESKDFPMAFEAANALDEELAEPEIFRFAVLMRWSELDPARAADYLRNNPQNDSFTDETKDIVLPFWMQQDEAAAIRWAKQLPDSDARNEMLERILTIAARQDPEGAIAFGNLHAPELMNTGRVPTAITEAWRDGSPEVAARRLEGSGDTEGLRHVAARWEQKDRASALRWAGGLTDPIQRAAALAGVFGAWAREDFRGALAAIAEVDDGAGGARVFEELLTHSKWPMSDTAAVQAQAAALPAGEARMKGYGAIASTLAREDVTAATTWMEQLPPGAEKDEAIARFADEAVDRNGTAALEWAGTIDDSKKRADTMRKVLQRWFSRDAAAAYDWMQESDVYLPEEKKAFLRGG